MPDTVPTDWQVRCRLIRASLRPPSPVQLGVSYDSVDVHESVSLTQAAAADSIPFVHLMSDNLTRDQLLSIAAGLRPAPTTSEI